MRVTVTLSHADLVCAVASFLDAHGYRLTEAALSKLKIGDGGPIHDIEVAATSPSSEVNFRGGHDDR